MMQMARGVDVLVAYENLSRARALKC